MQLHFNGRHGRSARADKVRTTTENRDLQPNVESGISKPRRDRFPKVGLQTKGHTP